jgi:hypothetical protein
MLAKKGYVELTEQQVANVCHKLMSKLGKIQEGALQLGGECVRLVYSAVGNPSTRTVRLSDLRRVYERVSADVNRLR